jgi:hypothetical protein
VLISQHVLGPSCDPILLVGPKPLREVLQSLSKLESLAYDWVDGINLLNPSQQPGSGSLALNSGRSSPQPSSSSFFYIKPYTKCSFWSGSHTKELDQSVCCQSFADWWTVEASVTAKVQSALSSLGLKSMYNVRAVHCAHSWGVVFQSRRGWKVSCALSLPPPD